ncbi:hypothetical protein EV284_6384 [Streptomyces sp. BK022]|uniref:hypothetical protein n=1 Tax=Streptomyces sp. BK022 TaxID=2512123 RepID=UPI001029323F|nr:hypothetical protein [Streptomyces sp. BK022]RZU28218.1 hypothetical protein EV284_6384 [Streptomyces sp. BK022]
MSTTSKLAQRFAQIRERVDLAETYAEDGATMTAMQTLTDAVTAILGMIQPSPDPDRKPMPLEQLVETVEGALYRRTAEQVAAVPWVAEAIGLHDPRIRALGEVAALAEQQYRAALVEWIGRDWTCLCVVSCAEDPATACSLSGERHVHPEIPGRPGVYGPCPVHPDAPGDH